MKRKRTHRLRLLTAGCIAALSVPHAQAQELNAKFAINYSKVSNTKTSVFETLENTVTAFLNERQWTGMQYKEQERINCSFSYTVSTYSETDNSFTGTMTVQSTRPVYNTTYTTTVFSIQDATFNFAYQEHDQLEFRKEQIDNNLTALLAYYVYLIIGMDMDTMAPQGGSEVLHIVEDIVNGAQNLGYPGWKAFEDSKNRYAIITDYMDGALEPMRQFQYDYYRRGLDTMADNAKQGRATVTEAVRLFKQAHENKTMSLLPQIFTDIKRDELVNIYGNNKATQAEKQEVYDILSRINASQNTYWDKIKK
ncbi:MAG: DUF4835 family protein [Clostridium sp.]|nr:DUF4835 family protein [Clostridium sp.]